MNFDRSLLDGELQCATYMGRAMHCKADIYTFDGAHFPVLMREVWRLRDLAFREVGVALDDSANGCASDCDGSCRQLIVWDAEAGEIVGGYRYALGADVAPESLSIWRYFTLAPCFVNDYLPSALELGRSFVSPRYQRGSDLRTIYALDALWEGLGRVVVERDVRYLFGRVTLYPSLGVRARNLLIGFMRYLFPSREILVTARTPFRAGLSRYRCHKLFVGETIAENYRILLSLMRRMRRGVPPIISSYMRLSPTMQTFDTYENGDLGGVAETAIMLTVDDFYDSVKRRYLVRGSKEKAE